MYVLRFTVACRLFDSFFLPKIPRTSARQSTVVIRERVEIAVSDEAGAAQCDS